MRINSVPDVKCFNNNKNVLPAQSIVGHFVRHPVYCALSSVPALVETAFQKLPLSEEFRAQSKVNPCGTGVLISP